jgi:hypothetical protein
MEHYLKMMGPMPGRIVANTMVERGFKRPMAYVAKDLIGVELTYYEDGIVRWTLPQHRPAGPLPVPPTWREQGR